MARPARGIYLHLGNGGTRGLSQGFAAPERELVRAGPAGIGTFVSRFLPGQSILRAVDGKSRGAAESPDLEAPRRIGLCLVQTRAVLRRCILIASRMDFRARRRSPAAS